MFIQVFGDDARQQFLISVSNAAVSLFAPLENNERWQFCTIYFFSPFFLSSCFYSHSFFTCVIQCCSREHICPDRGFHPYLLYRQHRMDVLWQDGRRVKKDTNLSMSWSGSFWATDVFCCNDKPSRFMNLFSQPVLGLNSSFDSLSFTLSSYVTVAFEFSWHPKNFTRLLWIYSRTDSSNFLLKVFLLAPSIRIL